MAFLQVWQPSGPEVIQLAAGRITIGKHSDNGLALIGDPTVSRLHAVVERYETGWVLRDIGSTNGTYLNGHRLVGESVLRPGDEIRIGATRIVFRPEPSAVDPMTATQTASPPPELTRREQDVLVALCRPLLGGDAFTEPASVKDVATALVVTEAAVKHHLTNLYSKFGIDGGRRRLKLANDAIARGAVTVSHLRADDAGDPS